MSFKGWKSVKLGKLVEINARSITGNYSFDKIEYIDTSSVTNNRFEPLQKVKLNDAPSRARRIVRDGDTIVSTVRPIQKHIGFIRNPKPNTIASTGFVVLTPKKIHPEFLYYYISQDTIIYYLNGIAETTTTTFPAFRPDTLEDLEIEIPENIETQRRIAGILSALDEKIELNRQTNATLEAIAQAIFKEWFVDFNFPGATGEMVESKLGMIPKGWRVGSILEIASLLSGGTPSTQVAEYWYGQIKWVSAKDVSNAQGTFVLDTERKISQAGVDNSNTKILPALTTIVTARGTVGSYCVLAEPMAMNQTNYGLKAQVDRVDYFVFFSLANLVAHLRQAAYGTIFDTVTTKTFEQSTIVIPPIPLTQNFNSQVMPTMEQILNNLRQSTTLAALRDALLPKLMRGEIEV